MFKALASLAAWMLLAGSTAAQTLLLDPLDLGMADPLEVELPLIETPQWIVGPADVDFDPFYPVAIAEGRSLTVAYVCRVHDNGLLGGCRLETGGDEANDFNVASLRVLTNLRYASERAVPEGEVAGPMGRVRVSLTWNPPADVDAASRITGVSVEGSFQTSAADYPQRANERGIESGWAVLACVARTSGRMESCMVIEAQPAGVGFGPSGIVVAQRQRVIPATLDGQPIDDLVIFPVNFRLP
jgi:hypothetical protein